MLKSISEIVDKHSFNVEVRKEGSSVILTPIEKKEEDLPIDTPVICSDNQDTNWVLRYYSSKGRAFGYGLKSDSAQDDIPYNYIIPFDKFDPNNIEESLKYNIVK